LHSTTTVKGVLWDLDGVLVDTGEYHFQSWVTVLSGYDIPFSKSFFRETFGMNNKGVLTALLGEHLTPDLLAEISDRKEEAFREAVRSKVQPLPGVVSWLEYLQSAGFRQGIASSAPLANIDALVDEMGLRPFFQTIISGGDMPGKPAPDLFLKVAEQLGVPPARCIVVEDAVAGVEAAVRAGMKCIAVTTTNPAKALGASNVVVDQLTELLPDTFEQLLVSQG
jgi:beta-phosphoglucomutase family hydrolase